LFVHHGRISSENKEPRMNQEAFVNKLRELEDVHKNVSKVWVCGPPILQEQFDRAQQSIPDKKIDYHIL